MLNTVKGVKHGAAIAPISAALHGAWCLYVQDDIDAGPPDTTFYLTRWLWLEGGSYEVRSVVNDTGVILINKVPVHEFAGGYGNPVMPRTGLFTCERGYQLLEVSYTNGTGPAYIAWEFLRNGAPNPEYVSDPGGWEASSTGFIDIGPPPVAKADPRFRMPVFLPYPNWRDTVVDRLEWYTNVHTSETGAEQRRSVRRNPRRWIESTFTEWDDGRRILDLTVAGVGTFDMVLPIWADKTAVEEDAPQGTALIAGDFRLKDFSNDSMAVIRDPNDMFHYEVVEYRELTDTRMTLTKTLTFDWPAGSQIYPIRAVAILDSPEITQQTSNVAEWSMRFTQRTPEVRSGDADMLPKHPRTGLPVLTLMPNWRQNIAWSMGRTFQDLDNVVGLRAITDISQQTFATQRFSYMLKGRGEMDLIRRLLFWARGKQMLFHIPTMNDDLTLAREYAMDDNALVVHRVGYSQHQAAQQDIRRGVMLWLLDGTYSFNTVVSSRIIGDEEWLYLEDRIPNLLSASVRRISYLALGRLDTDTIEINRHTDSDGVSEISLMFKTLDDRRVPKRQS